MLTNLNEGEGASGGREIIRKKEKGRAALIRGRSGSACFACQLPLHAENNRHSRCGYIEIQCEIATENQLYFDMGIILLGGSEN